MSKEFNEMMGELCESFRQPLTQEQRALLKRIEVEKIDPILADDLIPSHWWPNPEFQEALQLAFETFIHNPRRLAATGLEIPMSDAEIKRSHEDVADLFKTPDEDGTVNK